MLAHILEALLGLLGMFILVFLIVISLAGIVADIYKLGDDDENTEN